MRISVMVSVLLIMLSFGVQASAQENQKPETILGKMAFKLVRGVTNAATCVIEIPKQIQLTTRDRGTVGIVTGPIKGIGMTVYRAFAGAAETALFLVPQPGYYDSIINPDFVWNGWEDTRPEQPKPKESEPAEVSNGSKEK